MSEPNHSAGCSTTPPSKYMVYCSTTVSTTSKYCRPVVHSPLYSTGGGGRTTPTIKPERSFCNGYRQMVF